MSEISLQAKCFQHHWNTRPDERGLLCYNLNNSRNVVDGVKNKAIGLIKGRADMTYYRPGGSVVFLEFKTETGTQSPAQVKWQEIVEKAGYRYEIIRTFEQFKKLLARHDY